MAELMTIVIVDELKEVAKDMIRDNEYLDKIVKYSKLDESTIKQIKRGTGQCLSFLRNDCANPRCETSLL